MRFGTIVSFDHAGNLVAMLLRVDQRETEKRTARVGRYSEVWKAVVLNDDVWPTGLLVTVPPDMQGFRLVEENPA